jgi:hypothetical protein
MFAARFAWEISFLFIHSTQTAISIPFQVNQFIEVIPTNFFVRLYFDKIVSEDVGPSSIPLSFFVKTGYTQNTSHSDLWCRFSPSYSFIGVRSVNVMNLVFTNLTECLISLRYPDRRKCGFLSFVSGTAFYSSENQNCMVNSERMHTFVFAELKNKEPISENTKPFWNQFGRHLPNLILLFYSPCKPFFKEICNSELHGDDIRLHCVKFTTFSSAMLSNIHVAPKRWSTSFQLNFSPNKNSSQNSILRELFNQQDIDEFLITEVLRKANESGSFSRVQTSSTVTKYVEWEDPSFRGQYILVDKTETGFLSCFSTPKLKFGVYFKPFSWQVWISLVLSCFSIAAIIGLYNHKFKLSQSFSPLFFFVSTLLEEPYSVPTFLWNNRVFKCFTATWILTAMIFTNLYIGLMITDVTSPLQGEVLSTFDQVLTKEVDLNPPLFFYKYEILKFWKHNYTKSVNVQIPNIDSLDFERCDDSFDSVHYESHHAQFRGTDSFALLQSPLKNCGGMEIPNHIQKRLINYPWMYSGFRNLMDELQKYPEFEGDLMSAKLIVAFFSPTNRHYPNDPKFNNPDDEKIPYYLDAAVENELVRCKKSVFIGEKEDLRYELLYLKTNYPRAGFYMSSDTLEKIGLKPNIWSFSDFGNSKVPYFFKQLIEAGVRQFIVSLRKQTYYLKRRQGTALVQLAESKQAPQGLKGSIQTIFFIWIAFCLVSSAAFVCESVTPHLFSIKSRISNKGSIIKFVTYYILEVLFRNVAKIKKTITAHNFKRKLRTTKNINLQI